VLLDATATYNRVSQAESTIALFTKHEGDPQYNLYDMQCRYAMPLYTPTIHQQFIALTLHCMSILLSISVK
jgi:hypothetical protein